MSPPQEIVAADIGGTHARFALARLRGGRVAALDAVVTLRTADHASLQLAWERYGREVGRPLPRAAALAVAAPVAGEVLQLTNNPWVIRPGRLDAALGLERHVLVNDFTAVGFAVAELGPGHFRPVCGPAGSVGPAAVGVTSIVGPGTGLGVAQLLRAAGTAHVLATEGGHADFAPLDAVEDAILQRLRLRLRRVSVERVVSGRGLTEIHAALCAMEGAPTPPQDDAALWTLALGGGDPLAAAALERFCLSLGAFAGDVALVQGAAAVVLAGGLGRRLAEHLPRSGFAARFRAKGRFESRMAALPVSLVTHPEPGLFGAAAAFLHAEARAAGAGVRPSCA